MKKILCVIICLMLFSGCSGTLKRYNALYTDVFDTVTEFTAYCRSQEEFDMYSEAVHGELLRLHKIFDIYSDYPDLKNAKFLNENAGEWIEVPEELYELCEGAVSWHEKTGGQLNIALGSVLTLWHAARETENLPEPTALTEAGEHCDIRDIEFSNRKIRLNDQKMRLDFGAFAKGYAAEKASQLAAQMGLESFALSCGGNVVTAGEKPSGKWEIGVESPSGGLVTTVKVSDLAVVTSGDYQRFFEVGGVRYHHIIDPKTLQPASYWHSVTVIAPSSRDADALSTALFCLSLDEGQALLEEFGAEALWVPLEGDVIRSAGFKEYE